MKIYQQEKTDGLEDLILSKGSILFDCEVKPSTGGIAKASKKNSSLDIFGLESVLVSVGWNANDDVFDRLETWRARATPIDKKFNFMHNEKDIIGHITSAKVLDIDGNVIPDDTPEDKLPDFFEISVASVMYSIWEDKTLQERANNLMSEIPDGKWFVSMEVLFPEFDYALSKGSEQKVLERNEETSFLTKHLRIYNGKGEYEGWKVGRILKDMFFSGKGLVNVPANKRSLITSCNFNGAKASSSIFNEVKMSVEQKDYDKAVADLGAAKQTLGSVTSERDLLKTSAESLKNDLESSKALTNDLKDQVALLKTEAASKDEKLAQLNKNISELLENAQAKDRLAQLVAQGVEQAKAEQLVSKFAKATDEMFAEVVDVYKAQKAVATKPADVKDETKKLEKTEASTKEDGVLNQTPEDESVKLLELSSAFIKQTLKSKEVK